MSALLTIKHVIDHHPPVVLPTVTVLEVVRMMQDGTVPRWNLSSRSDLEEPKQYDGYVLVLELGEVKGMLTDRDIVRLTAENCDFADTLMADVITSPVDSMQMSDLDNGVTAMKCLQTPGVQAIPIVDGSRLVGVVSAERLWDWRRAMVQQQGVESQASTATADLRFQSLYEQTPVMLHSINGKGALVSVSNYWLQKLGYQREEVLGRQSNEFLSPTSQRLAQEVLQEFKVTGVCQDVPYEMVTKAGVVIDVLLSAIAEQDATGQFVRTVAVMVDVTDRNRAAAERNAANQALERIHSALQSTIEGISEIDSQGNFVEVNPAYAQCCGYTPDELVGLPWQTTIFISDIPLLESAYNIMLDTGKISLEARGVTQQGMVFHQKLTMVASLTEQGEFLGHYCFMEDISDRKQAEAQLKESEQRFQAMADSSPTLIWVANDNNKRTYFNAEWLKFTGRTLQQEVTEGWASRIHPEDVESCLAIYAQAFEQRHSLQLEYRFQNFQGDYHWLLDTGRPRYLANGKFAGYVGSCLDITPFKEVANSLEQANCQLEENISNNINALVGANALLQESESRFRSLADSLPALIWLCDVEQDCIYVNQTWQIFTGQSLEQARNQGWLETLHPDDRSRFIDQFQTSFTQQIPLQLEYRRRDSNGQYRWILNTGIPRYLSDQFVGMIGCGLDITELQQSRKALEQAVADLKRSNRDLEEFAYVASHDLREPLRKIKTFSELLLENYADQLDDTGQRYFNYVIDGAERMDALVQSVLDFSRVGHQVQSLETVDLNVVVQQIANDYSLLIEQAKGWIIYDELPTVKAGKIEMAQLLQNLIGNALKFHGDQPPHIKVTCQRQGPNWQIAVRDTGVGIAPEFCDRVFTMFAREHHRNQYPGTGIGLSICRKIVENYGGQIDFESELGKGTTFFFTLPAID